jgi:hypothetical protein
LSLPVRGVVVDYSPEVTKSLAGAAIGLLAAGAVVCAAPAQAEQGGLLINGHSYTDASGCVTVHTFPLHIRIVNNTAQQARVFLLPGCRGGVTKSVSAGDAASPIGASVLP